MWPAGGATQAICRSDVAPLAWRWAVRYLAWLAQLKANGSQRDRTRPSWAPMKDHGATMIKPLIAELEKDYLRKEALAFEVGDTVDVHVRITEGDKERTQVFSGTVIGRRGRGLGETFTVRRIVSGEGVERIFPVNSPKISKIDVKRHGKTRRAKLYYLRDRVGKQTRLRERQAKVRVAGEAGSEA